MSDVGGPERAKQWDWPVRRRAAPVAVAFMLGIFLYRHLPHQPLLWTILLAGLIALCISLFGRAWLCTGATLVATFLAGLALAQVEAFRYPANHISVFAADQRHLAQLELSIDNSPRVLTWTFESEVSGPYSRVRYAASATTVPTCRLPCTESTPPTP